MGIAVCVRVGCGGVCAVWGGVRKYGVQFVACGAACECVCVACAGAYARVHAHVVEAFSSHFTTPSNHKQFVVLTEIAALTAQVASMTESNTQLQELYSTAQTDLAASKELVAKAEADATEASQKSTSLEDTQRGHARTVLVELVGSVHGRQLKQRLTT